MIASRQHPTLRSLLGTLVALLALSVALSAFAVAQGERQAAAGVTEDEAGFVNLINSSRASSGLAPLADDAAAANVARSWAQQMATAGRISHNPNLAVQVDAFVTSQWTRIGENVGAGSSVSGLHDALMASQGHRANILGDFNRVGIGVARDGSGRIYVTEVFIKGPALRVSHEPRGSFEVASLRGGQLRVGGWAIDPDTSSPIEVHVYVDSGGSNLGPTKVARPDVVAAFPSVTSTAGFDSTIGIAPGWHWVCAYAINVGVGSNQQLGCKLIVVSADPMGAFDHVSQVPGGLRVSGWVLDPETASAIETHVYVDGGGTNLGPSKLSRPDVGAAFEGYGAEHGFDGFVPATPGWHQVCAYGINAGWGSNRLLGCKWAFVNPEPVGSLDGISVTHHGLRAVGWAMDLETDASIDVHLYVGAAGANLGPAAAQRLDLARVFPGYGAAHGFDATVPVSSGQQQVCAYAINVAWGANRLLGCKTVVVP